MTATAAARQQTPRRRVRRLGAIAAGTLLVGACASAGQSLETEPEVMVTRVESALHAPVWSYREHALVALTDDQRVAVLADPANSGNVRMRLSPPMAAGRNIQISRKDDNQLYVPQPKSGVVAVVDLTSLRPVGSVDAGPAPAYLAEDAGMRILLALSADGTTVTPVEEYGYRKLPAATIAGAPAHSIDGTNRGRSIEYQAYSPSGIRHYKGSSSPPELRGVIGMDVTVSAGDGTQVARSYVAGRDDNTLYAVDSRRGGKGLEVLGTAELPAALREIGTDDTRIYAATNRQLVVLETASFTGYPGKKIPIIRVVDYRAGLPGSSRSAPLSGLAVGPHRVYLTLRGTPYVVSVAKPRL
ncbi:YncE family protein [Mycobacterium asiaticum]|uniref:Uncharacterized protein n=1 Tax=Mycobacterium asiaticum TaxID=1790 RepID=A0A1A3DGC1_MYCAS|nr:hypothetical protein [Mycobacterium asiaticum]OBI72916.1 hypothetical protein A9X01_06940 [Mycobacterium asiaticum]OBI97777.1 hypothetical protein A5661_17120 [Mycobacterium asiaticum]ORA14711.1 hypothetical protein BST16_10720 [Mycobacterium asiaticum DSM 44297]